jgi:uroporphyrin-3 C-methyltransferase
MVAALKQSDDRLARYNQPRLEGVRRAIARDLEKIKAASVTDVATLSLKLDELVRMVDDMPMLSQPERRKTPASAGRPSMTSAGGPSAVPQPIQPSASWWSREGWSERWRLVVEHVLSQARSLVRVTRIDHPHAMLLAPEEAFFLRENLKLRLLNARLALLSRQFETSQSDLQLVSHAFERYFDQQSRRTTEALETVRAVASQARQIVVPRPDNTLAALSAMTGTR